MVNINDGGGFITADKDGNLEGSDGVNLENYAE